MIQIPVAEIPSDGAGFRLVYSLISETCAILSSVSRFRTSFFDHIDPVRPKNQSLVYAELELAFYLFTMAHIPPEMVVYLGPLSNPKTAPHKQAQLLQSAFSHPN